MQGRSISRKWKCSSRRVESELRHPSVVGEYVRAYHDERKRLPARMNGKWAQLELRLGDLNREIDLLVEATARGRGDPAVLGSHARVLDEEPKQVARELIDEPA